MFGKTIDYLLLSPFTHSGNLKTEEELDSCAAREPTPLAIEDANFRLRKLINRLEGNFPISAELRYLDIGCGVGDIGIALAKAGCKKVTGIDTMHRAIDQARHNAKQHQVADCVAFICEDIHQWKPAEPYDVVLSHEALEHIEKPRTLLQKLGQLIGPYGIVVLAFGPLFHSPFGDHMNGFFRMQIPWRGVIFSEQAILRARRECYRPTDYAERFQDIRGGLNLMKYSTFLKHVEATGWAFDFLCVNPQLKRIPPLYHVSNILTRTPLIRNYFASSIYAVLRRRSE